MPTRLHSFGALLFVAFPLAQLPSPSAGTSDDGTGSLEAFLKRVRTEREAEHARLRPRVDELVKKLGKTRSTRDAKKLHDELDALGEEAQPLLIPYLDPGTNPGEELEKQSQEVAVILARSGNPALLEDLVVLAHTGSPRGRLLATRVLGASPEVERAAEALRAVHAEASGSLRAECVRSLARIAMGDPLIVAALSDTQAEVIAAGLRALADEPRSEPRAEVVRLLEDERRGAEVLEELVDYFRVPDQDLDEGIVSALIRFACREDLPPQARMKVLEGMPHFGVSFNSRLRKEVEPLLSSSDSAIKDSALIALTLLKDSRARRELMRFYDDRVKDNETWPLAYQQRGDIQFRIGEYRDAARDYREAIRLHKESARLPGNRDLWVSLARAHIRDGKLKAAYEALMEFGPSSDLRNTLRVDPDFLQLVEHSKYKDLFE